MNILIAPGNPSVRHYYRVWASELKHRAPQLSVQFHGYPEIQYISDSAMYIKALVSLFEESVLSFETESPLYLVGHSFGGNIALELLKKFPMHIEKCFLVSPFLMRPSFRGQSVLRGIRFLSESRHAVQFLAKNRRKLSSLVAEVDFLTQEEVLSAVRLARHEYFTISKRRDLKEVDGVDESKVKVFYSQGDTWCPLNTIERMQKRFEMVETSLSHDFIVSNHERGIMTDLLLKDILI